MHDHCSAETMSIEGLIGLQRTLSRSRNPFERVVGSLCLAGLLKERLAALPDRMIGHLMFDYVWNDMNLLSPELTICQVATERLLGSPVQAGKEDELGGQMMTSVWERTLYIGSLKDAEQLASTNPMQIAAVLSLCPEEIERKNPSIQYMRVPITDAQPISSHELQQVLEAIQHGLRQGNLLINCAAGFSRSPIMAAAWLDRCGYLNFEAAMQEIAKLRPITDPSPVLLASVKEELSR